PTSADNRVDLTISPFLTRAAATAAISAHSSFTSLHQRVWSRKRHMELQATSTLSSRLPGRLESNAVKAAPLGYTSLFLRFTRRSPSVALRLLPTQRFPALLLR